MRVPNNKKILLALALAFVFIFSVHPYLGAAAAEPSERWFIITIADKPVGYVHESASSRVGPEGEVLVFSSEMKMVLNRLGTKVELELLSSSDETKDGLLKRMTSDLKASIMSTRADAVIKDGTVEINSEAGGKSYTRSIPYTGTLLGEEGIRLLSQRMLKKPGDSLEFQTFAAELGTVSKGSRKLLGQETLRLGGRDIPTLKVEELIEAAAVKTTSWLDSGDFEVLKQEMPTPFGVGVFVLSDKDEALSATASGGELPAEMFAKSIVHTNVRLPKARAMTDLRLKLIHRNPDLGWPDMKTERQTVVSQDRETLVLEIRRAPVPKAAGFPVPATEKNKEYLEPNAYIQSDEAGIRDLAREIIGGEKDAFRAVLKLERWVAENMKFDLGIALAPSSEIYKNRRGTCVGYATILATLARAAGIPSRVDIGYVYALGMFGGHAWTEVLIGDEWVPADAAIVAEGPADAARIAMSSTSMREGAGSLGGRSGMQLFGQIDIKILDFAGADGKKIAVPDKAAPFTVAGDDYENPWLGVSLRKPGEFKFAKLDAVWPDAALLTLEGPDGAKAELQEHYLLPWKKGQPAAQEIIEKLGISGKIESSSIQGRAGFAAAGGEKAALVVLDDPEAWVLVAEGKSAQKLLKQIASGMRLQPGK